LQEVVRFLKVQEKVLTSAIVRLCEHKGIDTSDFKENLTAFINQGVINSGEIRGNVSSKISSLVIRRRGQRTRTGAVLNAVKVRNSGIINTGTIGGNASVRHTRQRIGDSVRADRSVVNVESRASEIEQRLQAAQGLAPDQLAELRSA
jgi:hypothetical protein